MNKRAAIAISVFVLLVGVTIAVIVLTTKSNYTTSQVGKPLITGCGTNCGEDICNRDDGKYPCVVKCCKGGGSCTCTDVPQQTWYVKNEDGTIAHGYPPGKGCICNGYGPCDGGQCLNCSNNYGDLGLDPKTSCTTCKENTVWDGKKCVQSNPGPVDLSPQKCYCYHAGDSDPDQYNMTSDIPSWLCGQWSDDRRACNSTFGRDHMKTTKSGDPCRDKDSPKGPDKTCCGNVLSDCPPGWGTAIWDGIWHTLYGVYDNTSCSPNYEGCDCAKGYCYTSNRTLECNSKADLLDDCTDTTLAQCSGESTSAKNCEKTCCHLRNPGSIGEISVRQENPNHEDID